MIDLTRRLTDHLVTDRPPNSTGYISAYASFDTHVYNQVKEVS
jgi:hypothetical protein